LLAALDSLNLKPDDIDYLILTHIHLDHAGGTGTLLKQMSNAQVIAHKRAVRHLIDPSRLWKASLDTLGDLARNYGEIEPVPEDKIITAYDGMKLTLGSDLTLELYTTPGHAPHHLSIFEPSGRTILAGDAAGIYTNGVIRPTTPPPFKLREALSSIDKLIAFKPGRLCFAHAGCSNNAVDMLGEVKAKILEWFDIIHSPANNGKTPDEIFIILREKDSALNYLGNLNKAEYDREYSLIINSIEGLSATSDPAR